MLRKVFWFLFAMTILGSAGAWAFVYIDWQRISEIPSTGNREEALFQSFQVLLPAVISIVLLAVFTWLASFDSNRRKRPFVVLAVTLFAAGSTLAILGHPMYLLSTNDSASLFSPLAGLFAGLGGVALIFVIGMVEFCNRLLWPSLARRFDRSNLSGPALFANRMSLLFKPGEEGMLRSVALARFRKGVRGDVLVTLRALYDAGIQDEDILECLAKASVEEKDSANHIKYLKELQSLLPEDEDLQEILVEALIEYREYREALVYIEKFDLTETIDQKGEYASLLLAEGSLEKAAEIAIIIGEEEGIPFRQSQALLRDILSRVSEYVPALNALAAQSSRMKQKEATIRWLEKSLDANPRQPEIRLKLIEMYRHIGNTLRLEALIEEELREHPKNADLLYELACMQNDNSKTEEALTTLGKILSGEKPPVKAYLLAAELYFEEDELEKAKELAENAQTAEPDEEQARRLDLLLIRIEKAVLTAEVAEVIERARANPGDLPLQMEALEKLISRAHADKIIGQVDTILHHHADQRDLVLERLQRYALEPDVPFPVLNLISDLQAAAGRFDEALEVIRLMGERGIDEVITIRDNAQKILRRAPHHLPTLKLLGDTFRAHGKFTDMIHSYSLYLSQGGEETEDVDRALANAYISLEDYNNAKRFVKQLLESENVDLELIRRIIPLALDEDSPEEAAEYMKTLELIDPKGAETKKLKARVDQGLGERRFNFLKNELESGKGSGGETLEQLGDIALEMVNYNEAITCFQRATRDKEDPSRARRCQAKLALCYMKKRLDDLASETLKEITISLDDDPKDLKVIMDILYDIGNLFLEFRMYNRAERVFKQLCKIDAGYRDVLSKIESLRA